MPITNQLNRLASMGMAIPDRRWAAQRLRHIGHHRLSRYWQPFEIKTGASPAFQPGTTFDDVMALYSFDGQLRSTLAHAMGQIEVSVRALWADHLAVEGGDQAHLDPALFSQQRYRQHLDELKQTYGRTAEWSSPKWESATIWEATDAMSFGQLSKWYNAIFHRRIRNAIAREYQLNPAVLSSILFNLSHLRNICAHHGRLWNRSLYTGLRIPRALAAHCNYHAQDGLYNRLVVTSHLTHIIDPRGDWKSALVELIENNTTISKERMGFPANWRQMQFWQV